MWKCDCCKVVLEKKKKAKQQKQKKGGEKNSLVIIGFTVEFSFANIAALSEMCSACRTFETILVPVTISIRYGHEIAISDRHLATIAINLT